MSRCRTLLLLLALAAVPAVAQTPETGAGAPSVDHAWARASAGKTGAAYLTIIDRGAPDRLTGASTPIAEAAELHQTSSSSGVMHMRPVEGGLPLEPGKPLTLAPGGYHLMLMGLNRPLKAGDSFPLTLTFAHAPPVTVQVAVGKAGSMAAEGAMGGMKMGQ